MLNYKPKPFLIGTDTDTEEAVYLAPKWLETHVQILGPTASGKTRLLLWLFSQLLKLPGATLIVLNAKGDLIRMARDTAINAGQGRRVVLFDPANNEHVIGYNPLRANGLAVETQAKAVREGIRSAWGQDSFDGTAQLARFLFLTLCAVRELGLTLVEAVQLLRVGSPIRRAVLPRLKNVFVREAFEYLDCLRDSRQEELTASTVARLEAFVMDETVRRIICQETHSLDLGQIIAGGQILLVNLEQYKPLRPDDVRLLGRLIINDVVSHVFSRTGRRTPVFLMIDECQTFTTQDLCLALDQGRELGLHCVLSHQFPHQLLREDPTGLLYGSVTESARTKMVFGGMNVEHLELIAKELFLSEFDPMKMKDERHTLELEPVESTRLLRTIGGRIGLTLSSSGSTSKTQGTMQGESETRGDSDSFGSSVSETSGTVMQNSEGELVGIGSDGEEVVVGNQNSSGISDSSSTSETATESHTTSRSRSKQEARTKSQGVASGSGFAVGLGIGISVTRAPFYEYRKRYVVSSRTFESFEEFLITCMQRLKGQPKGHFVLKTPTSEPVFLRAPFVRTPVVSRRYLQPALDQMFARSCYATPLEIEEETIERRHRIEAEAEPVVSPPKRRKSTERFRW